MHWIFYAVSATALSSAVNFFDKFIIRGKDIDYYGMPVYTSIMSLIYGLLFWCLTGFPVLGAKFALLAVISGMLIALVSVLYFKAIYSEATSKIIILFQIVPVMVLILSAVFLHEVVTTRQLFGFFFILLAATGLAVSMGKKNGRGIKVSTSVIVIILAADMLGAVSSVVLKFVLESNSFYRVVPYQALGLGVGGILVCCVYPRVRKAFVASLKSTSGPVLGLILLNEVIFAAASLLSIFAVSRGPVALVSVIGSTKVFFGIIYGWILTTIAPEIFEEDITGKGLAKSALFSIAIFAGLCLIY